MINTTKIIRKTAIGAGIIALLYLLVNYVQMNVLVELERRTHLFLFQRHLDFFLRFWLGFLARLLMMV